MPTNATPATNDATRDTTGRDSDATPGAFVASIGDAAKALNVSVRTVQRRIERGQMSVIERDGRRFVELPKGTPTDATKRATVTRQGATLDATTRQNDATGRDTEAERIAELKAEVMFLRNLVEAQQRDAVELRQSLKRALDLAPKQLTALAGASPPTGAAGSNGPTTANAPQRAPETRETDWNSVYANLADDLDGRLNQ